MRSGVNVPAAVTPLGVLSTGPVARVDDRGAVTVGNVTVGWSVRSEQRWHDAATELAVRQRRLRDTPVIETAMRIPSGDAVATTFAVADAGGAARVVTVIANESPLPVAVSVSGDEKVVRLSRPAVVDDDRVGQVVPLPHRQTVIVEYAPFGSGRVPDPSAVAAGWRAQADRGARLDTPISIDFERCLVALGPGRGAGVVEVAAHVEAALALGWFDAAVERTEWLLGHQRSRGRIGPDDHSTIAALRALAGWRRAGLPPDHLEHLVGPVAAAAHRLRRRPEANHERTAARWLLEVAGQTEAAASLREGQPPGRRMHTGPERDQACHLVTAAVDAVVAETDDGIDVCAGWDPTWRGVAIEAHQVPTRFGRVSLALRWHGDRPALLWELERWPDAAVGSPVWRAEAIDPAWSSPERSGEALLATPPAA
jgi:hypothetical protein